MNETAIHPRALVLALAFASACGSTTDAYDAAPPDAGPFALVGTRCTPEAIPSGGFRRDEVYIEAPGASCATGACVVFHLVGNPTCAAGDPRCEGPAASACFVETSATSLCLEADDPARIQTESNSPDRAFCTCRCSAGGNTALPLCACPAAMRCVPDSDPGGGYCVPDALALVEQICETDAECAAIAPALTCDATRHCR